MPGDIFHENSPIESDPNSCNINASVNFKGKDTFRIGFGRVNDENIKSSKIPVRY